MHWYSVHKYASVLQTVIACGVSFAFNFQANYGVEVVGKIPDR